MSNISGGAICVIVLVLALGAYGLFFAEQPGILSFRISTGLRAEEAVKKLKASEQAGREVLHKAAEHKNERIRYLAMKSLASGSRQHSFDVFLAGLDDPDAKVRCEAVRGIKNCPETEEAVLALVAAFDDRDAKVRAEAVRKFEDSVDLDLDERPFRKLINSLRNSMGDTEKEVRIAALKSLDNLNELNEKTAAVFAECLKKYNKIDDRLWAAENVTKLGGADECVIHALAECLEDKNQDLRIQSCQSLESFGSAGKPAAGAIVKMLDSADCAEEKLAGVNALSAVAPKEPAALEQMKVILTEFENSELRISAVNYIAGMGRQGESATGYVIAALRRNAKEEEIDAAAAALKQIGPAAIIPLIRVLAESGLQESNVLYVLDQFDVRDKTAAVRTFTPQERKYVSDIIDKINSQTNAQSKLDVLTALGPEQDYVIPELMEYLEPRSAPKDIQIKVAALLGNYGTEASKAVPVLTDALSDEDSQLCLESIKSLRLIGLENCDPVSAQAALKKLGELAKNDSELYIRQAARETYEILLKRLRKHKKKTSHLTAG